MKYLVTGGSGFIGSHLVDALIDNNHEVVVYDNFSSGKRQNLTLHKNLHIVKGDIRNIEDLRNTSTDIDGIFHLAALVQVQRSVANPALTESINSSGTLNVLQIAREQNVKIVLSSSASVYKTNDVALTEDSSKYPMSPYALSKLHNEQQAQMFNDLYSVDVVSLRYFNVYGDRQDASSPYSGVISIFKQCKQNNQPAIVYGTGLQVRDFIHVSDVAKANIAAMQHSSELVYNIGSGVGTSVNDLIQILDLTPEYKKPRDGEPLCSIADVSLATLDLKFSADRRLLVNSIKE
jgi:UDP-glucose 4-epimerase